MIENPLVSIITVCYNSEETISDTLNSVVTQNYSNIEYIIVDGLSSDNTLKIVNDYVEKYNNINFRVISEKDKGLYDAMNKGIKLAQGSIIAIINSDDFYMYKGVISDVVNRFVEENVELVYGDLIISDKDNTEITMRKWISGYGKFNKGWSPPHPATFIKKEVYEKYGYFDTSFRIAADYDILYRFIEKYNCSISYINKYLVKMRMGGESTRGFQSIVKSNKEVIKSLKKNGVKRSTFVVIRKIYSKVKQLNFRKFFKKEKATSD